MGDLEEWRGFGAGSDVIQLSFNKLLWPPCREQAVVDKSETGHQSRSDGSRSGKETMEAGLAAGVEVGEAGQILCVLGAAELLIVGWTRCI